MSWKTLGAVPATDLVDARLQLHHAAQIVASAAVTFLEPTPDDSHPNLGWREDLGALCGRRLPKSHIQVALRVADLSLLLVGEDGRVRDEWALDGKTLEDGYAWLETDLSPPIGITRAVYEIPNHATASGARFSLGSGAAFDEMARWFGNGHRALADFLAHSPNASEVRCWPHHFDLGALIVIENRPDGGLAKSVGIGLSPGDESYAEPYAYVSPWPYPDEGSLPTLDNGGHWHVEGHTSAILLGSDIIDHEGDRQNDFLRRFLDTAVEASRRVLAA